MPSKAQDFEYWRSAVTELKSYLLSEQLFWPLTGGRGSQPRLTLGGLLLAQARLQARPLTQGEAAELGGLEGQVATQAARWRSAWERKAAWEFQSRLKQWGNYLDEYRANQSQAAYYPQEVALRTMLHLLETEAGELDRGSVQLLAAYDELLRALFIPGDFVWEDELRSAFEPSTYWYLYGRPKQ
jgi:hypothetical protein